MLPPFLHDASDPRRELEAHRQFLLRRLDLCQRLASGLRDRASSHRAAGKDPAQMEQLAREVEEACRQLRVMLRGVEQEIAEVSRAVGGR